MKKTICLVKTKSISGWAKKHKKDIISVVAVGSVTIISVALGVKYKDLLKDLLKDNVQLTNKCNDLLKENNSFRKENNFLNKEIVRLTDLCLEKDEYFMETISDGLRHGSSLAAKHMADRKEYLKLVG